MIPQRLGDWTFEAVTSLCAAGQSESDRHDFKYNLSSLPNITKLCCAFANTFGGTVILGIRDSGSSAFEIVGLDADKELYGKFVAKIRSEPQIDVAIPQIIEIPQSTRVLYAFQIPQSTRRPHLPIPADQRTFWKRQGSDCVQMTLEEIRYQMNDYEEKREKLALLLIDLQHKLRSLEEQSNLPSGQYAGDMFGFEIIDRVVADSYALLKQDTNIIGALDMIRRYLLNFNSAKQRMLAMLPLSYDTTVKQAQIDNVREEAKRIIPATMRYTEQIERSLRERFGVLNPYKQRGNAGTS